MLKGYNFDLAARFVSDYKLPVSIISDANVFEYELNLYEKEYQSLTKMEQSCGEHRKILWRRL